MTQVKQPTYRVVIGLGQTGLSVIKYCEQQQWPLVVMDSRVQPPNLVTFKQQYPHIHVACGEFDRECLLKADEIILSPGISPFHQALTAARAAAVPIIGDIELFARVAKAPILAITGTNGKGTVTTLVTEILSSAGYTVQLGGNIGIPVLDLLSQPVPDFYVLELSSAQLQVTYSLEAQTACILNISADHEDYHADFAAYCNAKHRLYMNAKRCVYSRDDVHSQPRQAQVPVCSFGSGPPSAGQFGISDMAQEAHFCYGSNSIMALREVALKGHHNTLNILAALAIVQPYVSSWQAAQYVLRHFKGLAYRCQLIRTVAGVAWYNDAKSTNTAATTAAIQSVAALTAGKLILIMGGIAKQQDLTELKSLVKQFVNTTIVYGRDAKRLAQQCEANSDTHHVGNLEQALQCAKQLAHQGDAVLLSPACASFDMFSHAEQRGDYFSKWVEDIVT